MDNEAINELIKGIQYLVEQTVKNASFDKIKNGKIVSANTDGTYEVLIENGLYKVPALRSDSLSVGSIVKVVIPQNEYSNMFILN